MQYMKITFMKEWKILFLNTTIVKQAFGAQSCYLFQKGCFLVYKDTLISMKQVFILELKNYSVAEVILLEKIF